MGTFNTYGRKTKKYGGAYPVWLTVSQKERTGSIIYAMEQNEFIPAGTLVKIDRINPACVVHTFEVCEPVALTDEYVYVHACKNQVKPRKGLGLMKCPEKGTDKGKGAHIESVEPDGDDRWKFKIAPGAFGVLKKGDYLISCIGSGDNVFACLPTGITENDVRFEESDEVGTVASVYHGEIMEDRIQAIPPLVKSLLPMIRFLKGI